MTLASERASKGMINTRAIPRRVDMLPNNKQDIIKIPTYFDKIDGFVVVNNIKVPHNLVNDFDKIIELNLTDPVDQHTVHDIPLNMVFNAGKNIPINMFDTIRHRYFSGNPIYGTDPEPDQVFDCCNVYKAKIKTCGNIEENNRQMPIKELNTMFSKSKRPIFIKFHAENNSYYLGHKACYPLIETDEDDQPFINMSNLIKTYRIVDKITHITVFLALNLDLSNAKYDNFERSLEITPFDM